MTTLLGVVLTGGAGRRLGRRKGDVLVGGVPLVVRARRALAPTAGSLAVVGSGEAVPEWVPVRPDLRPGQGPLAGLETALAGAREVGHAGVVVLACDLPLVPAALPAELARRWRDMPAPQRSAVVSGTGADRQPLCAVYGVDLLEGLSAHLDRSAERSVQGWLDGVERLREVALNELGSAAGDPPGAALLNLNRPEDLETAELLVDTPPPVVTVVGWKDSGKTTVAVALVGALKARGLRVVAFKHGHRFRIDTPGTDSWRLRHEGGAERVVLAGPAEHASFGAWGPAGEPSLGELVRAWAGDADIVVAEGWKDELVPAVEVRGGTGKGERPPLASADLSGNSRFIAVVGSGQAGADEPPRCSPVDPDLGERLAELVLRKLLPDRARGPEGCGPSLSKSASRG